MEDLIYFLGERLSWDRERERRASSLGSYRVLTIDMYTLLGCNSTRGCVSLPAAASMIDLTVSRFDHSFFKLNQPTCYSTYIPPTPVFFPLLLLHILLHRYNAFLAQNLFLSHSSFFSLWSYPPHPTPLPPPSLVWSRASSSPCFG